MKHISLAKMRTLCPACAKVMEELGLTSIETEILADAFDDASEDTAEAKVPGLPPTGQKHYKSCMEEYDDKSYCASVAWSIYCKNINPDSEHCKQGKYFDGKGKGKRKKKS